MLKILVQPLEDVQFQIVKKIKNFTPKPFGTFITEI